MPNVEIYTVDYCPYCKKAEMLLKEKNVNYKKFDITENEEEERKKLGEKYGIEGRVTVPQIFINGRRIGGWDVLSKLDNAGSLDTMLED